MGPLYFIKRIALFTIFSLLLYVVGVITYVEFFPKYFQKNIFYEKFAYGFSNTRFKEVKRSKNVDILFLGSSRSYRHYDPRIFSRNGYSSFNLGSSAQTFIQTEVLVKRYLDSLNPRYIIFDIYPGMFSSDGVESSFDLISNDYNNLDTFYLSLKLKNIKVINTWIYAFYKEYLFNSLDDREEDVKGVNKYISGGYVEREITTSDVISRTKEKWNYNERQWKSFIAIVEHIKGTNSKLLIVHSPRQSGFEYEGADKLTKYLESVNLPFYNYKGLEIINDSMHFYEASHMNQKGVNLYNDFLLEKHFK